ncbi:hypothetical protein M9H77_07876 [Catharanthus roseus]|uniref:Uncharacterized protein n=1 Tax=Catharanthus roseus TaxID=4058 RepID=A0ACC0BWC0_CATRO|nr:hypothetical protein M9H77_07876 [Catharanthus roseus]
MEEFKEASLEGLEGSKTKRGAIMDPTASDRFYPTIIGRPLVRKGLKTNDLPRTVLLEVWRIDEAFAGLVDSSLAYKKVLHQGGDLGKVVNQIYMQMKIHIKVVAKQPPNKGSLKDLRET